MNTQNTGEVCARAEHPEREHRPPSIARRVQRWLAVGVTAATIPATVLLTAGTAAAYEPDGDIWSEPVYAGATAYEIAYCLTHGDVCTAARDAQQWAYSITAWKFPGVTPHDNAADAFRHCSWAGAMSQRVGYGRAVEVLSNHEASTNNTPAEYEMDISNNAVGAVLGTRSNYEGGSDTWGWIMNQCNTLARSGQLVTIK